MTVATLLPIGNGTMDEGTEVGGTDYQVLLSDDDATSYYRTQDSAGTRTGTFWMGALPPADLVSGVTMTYNVSKISGTSWYSMIGLFLAPSTEAVETELEEAVSWVERTSGNLSRPGGGDFAPSDFPGGNAGIEGQLDVGSTSGSSALGGYSTMQLNVTYTPAEAGGYYFLLASWLPPLIGLGHCLNREISAIIGRQRVRPESALDFEMIRKGLRELNRAYAFAG